VESTDPPADELERFISVCGFLPHFLDKGSWEPTTRLETLVLATLARSRGTYETIVDLVQGGRALQAAMLSRSLFEDMAVAHWLVFHHEDPDWLIDRYEDHALAMRLHEAEIRAAMGAPQIDDVSDIAGRADELRKTYGRYAQLDWWGRDRAGNRVSMPDLVERLSAAPLFQPRLKGEVPIMTQYYQLQHKTWTQTLHHTAMGTGLLPAEAGSFPTEIATPSPFLILFGNFWVFGQLIFVALDLGAPAHASAHFEKLFLAGIAVFSEGIGVTVPWADQIAGWADE
jgi:hypothetical protein